MKLENLKLEKKFVFAIISIIVLPILILGIIKLTPSHRNISKMNKIISKIEECNKSLKNCLDGDSINSENTKDILTNNTLILSDIKNELDSLKVVNKNESLKFKLSETLDYNLNLYQLTLNLLKDPSSSEIHLTFSEYSKTYELLVSNYDTLDLLGLDASFPEEAETFFSKSTGFINTIIKLNRESDIKVSQKKTYVLSLEECISLFDGISEDLRPALAKIKEDGRSLDVLLKDVKEKRSKFSELKSKTYSLTIPEDGNECYQVLQDTLNYYDLYIASLEHSIVVEKSSNNTENNENINNNYNNSFEKYEDFTDTLKDLKTELDKFNNK